MPTVNLTVNGQDGRRWRSMIPACRSSMPAQRPRAARATLRLRSGAMRSLYGPYRRNGGALLRPPVSGGKARCHARRPRQPEHPHPLQQAFIDEQAVQCGYCINGMIMQAKALLDTNRHPSEDEIKAALAGNLCRCGTHLRIVRAVKRAAEAWQEES